MRRSAERGLSCARAVLPRGHPPGAMAEGAGLIILPELYVRLKLAGSGLPNIGLYDPVPYHSVRLSYRGNRSKILLRGNSAPSVERP